MEPKVSIVIPFYNCPYINEAITSVLDQTYENKEIIVVNDGSTNNIEKITPFLQHIQCLEKPNGGTASALNLGIRHANGDYIAWLSSDDYFLPDKLEKQIDFMLKKQLKISFSPFYIINERHEIIHEPIFLKFYNSEQMKRVLKRQNFLNGSTAVIHKSIFEEVGYFNEALLYTQDYEYWLRVSKQFEIGYFEVPTIHYRVHNQMGTKKNNDLIKKEIQMVQNKYGP